MVYRADQGLVGIESGAPSIFSAIFTQSTLFGRKKILLKFKMQLSTWLQLALPLSPFFATNSIKRVPEIFKRVTAEFD